MTEALKIVEKMAVKCAQKPREKKLRHAAGTTLGYGERKKRK